jgi:AGCS family alanine or glycine:cation symporter
MPEFVALINGLIDHLSARVFAKVPFFGAEIEGIVLWLAVPMVLFTLYLGVPQFRGFRHAVDLVRGRFHDPSAPGEISQFQALATAISGTVGLGNIAGVAVAITLGGPGAVFWMFVIGFFAMALKCAEVTLGLKYREVLADGSIAGGPFYTLRNGLTSIGLPKPGRALGGFYAVLLLGGCLAFFQVNQSFAQVTKVTGFDNGWLFGIGFSAMVGLVILGSVRWMAAVTSRLVPLMVVLYVFGCLSVLVLGAERIPGAIALIVTEAFAPASLWGGAIGAFVVGMRRAVYSCEAGIGTAVIAHAQARTRDPASEGLVALLEPFIDTVLICTLTGLTVVVAGTWQGDLTGVAIVSAAFASVASWFPALLMVAVFLFAFSTVIANGFYGAQAFAYLFGRGLWRDRAFKLAFCCILPLGAVLDLGRVIDLIDSIYFLMAVPNIIGLYLLAPVLRREINSYLARVRSGAIQPSQIP